LARSRRRRLTSSSRPRTTSCAMKESHPRKISRYHSCLSQAIAICSRLDRGRSTVLGERAIEQPFSSDCINESHSAIPPFSTLYSWTDWRFPYQRADPAGNAFAASHDSCELRSDGEACTHPAARRHSPPPDPQVDDNFRPPDIGPRLPRIGLIWWPVVRKLVRKYSASIDHAAIPARLPPRGRDPCR